MPVTGPVQFSCSVVSNSFRPHSLQHASLSCPSPTPVTWSNSYPLNWWYHSTISSSVVPFSSCLQSFTASGSFLMNQFFASGGQSIGASASASVFLMNIQDWFPLDCLVWLPGSPMDSQESSPTPQFKSINSSALSFLYSPTLTPIRCKLHPTTRKTIALTKQTFVGKVTSLLFNMLPRLVITFLIWYSCCCTISPSLCLKIYIFNKALTLMILFAPHSNCKPKGAWETGSSIQSNC